MKQLHKVHRLPTKDDTAPLWLYSENKVEIHCLNETLYKETPVGQHLYFTSDEEPKEGDWYYDTMQKTVRIGSNNSVVDGYKRKIVATTDFLEISLGKSYKADMGVTITPRKQIPQISQQFVEEYVKAGGIDEVYLECTNKCKTNPKECEWSQCRVSGECSNAKTTDISYLKLDQNNCVITHPVKDNYKELRFLNWLALKDYITDDQDIIFEEWLKENLK